MYFSIAIIVIVVLFYIFGLGDYLTLKTIQDNKHCLYDWVHKHYFLSVFIYIASFSISLTCALPIVMPFALMGGFLYGFFWGLLYVEISCLLGSIFSFVILRYVIGHWIHGWHNERVERFNQQVQKYGYTYLLLLHFLSIIPLFVINLLAAMARVPLSKIIWITILGTLPLNLICVMAGQKLSTIQSFKDIFSGSMIVVVVLFGVVIITPLFIKKLRNWFGI